jgi:hypothetical protein
MQVMLLDQPGEIEKNPLHPVELVVDSSLNLAIRFIQRFGRVYIL